MSLRPEYFPGYYRHRGVIRIGDMGVQWIILMTLLLFLLGPWLILTWLGRPYRNNPSPNPDRFMQDAEGQDDG